MGLHELQRPAWHRVRVGAAARDEERGRAGVPLFQRGLGYSRVIPVKPHERVPQRRVVAGVPEDDGKRSALGAVDAQDRHGVIDGTLGAELHAPVRSKEGFALRVPQSRRTQPGDGTSDNGGELVFELDRVHPNGGPLLRRHVVRDRQLFVHDGTAVRMARVEKEVRAADSVTALNERRDPPGDASRQAQEIDGHENGCGLSSALERERLGVQRHRDTLRRQRAARETGHPERALRRDVDGRHTGLPRRRRERNASRRQADGRNGGQELATLHGHTLSVTSPESKETPRLKVGTAVVAPKDDIGNRTDGGDVRQAGCVYRCSTAA